MAAFETAAVRSAALPAAATKRSYRSTERGLTAKTKRVHRALRAKFPQIKRVLGKRAASSGNTARAARWT